MGDFFNNADVQKALHINPGSIWVDADETGPVADNLRDDFTVSVIPQVE